MGSSKRRALLVFLVLIVLSSFLIVYQEKWNHVVYYSQVTAAEWNRYFREEPGRVELKPHPQQKDEHLVDLEAQKTGSIHTGSDVRTYFNRQQTGPQSSPKVDHRVQFNNSQCKEKVTRYVLIKTEKTGSSTLFSILARFILRNQLNVMVMTKGGHLDVTEPRGAKPGWDIGPRKNEMADCLIHHARYNQTLLDASIKPGAKYVTLVRDAESWFTSAVKFWPKQLDLKSPETLLDGTAESDLALFTNRSVLRDEYNGQKTLLHLSQLQWLGFDYSQHSDMEAVKDYIQQITRRIDIGFLTDQFDACLILLRRRFCWDHGDIFYTMKEVGGRQPEITYPPLSQSARTYLLSERVNLGEQLLYQAFNASWWSTPEVSDPDFIEEVKQFKNSNLLAQQKCKQMSISNWKENRIDANRWSVEVPLTASYCKLLFQENYSLMAKVAMYAIGSSYDHTS